MSHYIDVALYHKDKPRTDIMCGKLGRDILSALIDFEYECRKNGIIETKVEISAIDRHYGYPDGYYAYPEIIKIRERLEMLKASTEDSEMKTALFPSDWEGYGTIFIDLLHTDAREGDELWFSYDFG